MRIVEFPGCCTAKIIMGFGGTETASWEIRPKGNMTIEDELRKFLTTEIKRYKNYATFVATTVTEQVTANKVLKEMGFVPSEPMAKNSHANTQLIVWHCALKTHPLNNVAQEAKAKPKRDALGRFVKVDK